LLQRRPYLIFHGIFDGGVEVCPAGFSPRDGRSLLGDLGGGPLLVDLDDAVVVVVEDAGGKAGWLEKGREGGWLRMAHPQERGVSGEQPQE
jgi:hypothetical protein